ncbi:hypothetical protein BpHYR1_044552 [Brachionus plicatilis]|uniref:Uncharacterized protein n=1 Tax=Brachionus plicatilis TaxID=10195 RepID=A0A3M7R131_BRAPC|nr:hypothetical protein BpHYR1_044552 [Brachionus plicatilis]
MLMLSIIKWINNSRSKPEATQNVIRSMKNKKFDSLALKFHNVNHKFSWLLNVLTATMVFGVCWTSNIALKPIDFELIFKMSAYCPWYLKYRKSENSKDGYKIKKKIL